MAIVSVAEAYPSKWLSSSDLEDGEIIATLANEPLDWQEFKQPGKSTPDRKPVLYFRCPQGTKKLKPMVLNKINFTMLTVLFGNDTDDWAGKQIVIGVDMVEAFGELKPGLRIRNRLPKPKVTASATATRSAPRSQPQPPPDPEGWNEYPPLDDRSNGDEYEDPM